MKEKKIRQKLPSLLRWVLWVILVQFILINISAAFYAYRLTHFYTDKSPRKTQTSDNIFKKTWKLFTGPKYPKSMVSETPVFAYDTISLVTAKGKKIDAWYAKTDSISRGTVVLFHGIASNKGQLVAEANEFRYMGYNIMMVDFRAHGGSEGNLTTIGVREAEEVKLAYDFIHDKGEKKIFLWGISMGAVVVMKALSDFSLQPAGVILELPFASLQSHLKARARVLGFPQQPFAFLVTGWIGIERGFNGYRHKTDNYAQKVNCPVLVQYGIKDSYVQKTEIEKVYNAIASGNKKLVGYEKADHESLLLNEPLKWRREISEFLNRATDQ